MAGVRDRKHYWQGWWWVDDKRVWGKFPKADFPRKRDALKEAMRREIDEEGSVHRNGTFKECAEDMLIKRSFSGATQEKFKNLIDTFGDFLSQQGYSPVLNAITETIIREYIDYRLKDHRPSGVNCEITYLRQIFKLVFEKGFIRCYPLEKIRYLKAEKEVKMIPTKEEVERILKWFWNNERFYHAWIYFEMTRGWRRDELRRMLVSDVDLAGEVLYVKHTKIKEQRRERLSREDCLVLNEHILLLKNKGLFKPDWPLFPSRNGKLKSKDLLLLKIKKACQELGITKNITNHSFRHYVVTSILDKTSNIQVVKAITGHKDTSTILDHYAHTTQENVERGLEITRINTGLG